MDRKRRAQLGGLTTSARHDPRVYTANAQAAFYSWDHATCPPCGAPGPLPDDLDDLERARRIEARRKLHLVRISALGVAARRRRAA